MPPLDLIGDRLTQRRKMPQHRSTLRVQAVRDPRNSF
jgi:hypothetical protein